MPTWIEFQYNFGAKELALCIFILACIILAREHRRIFGRKR